MAINRLSEEKPSPKYDSWEERFNDLKKTCETLAWVKTTQHKVSRLLWPEDPHLEVLCSQKGLYSALDWPADDRAAAFDPDTAYQQLHRLIRRFSDPEDPRPTIEELDEWFGLKHLIRGLLRKPRVERQTDDPIYLLLRTRLRELYAEVIATNREFVWTDFRDLFLSLFPNYPTPLALMQPSLQGAKLALRQPQQYRARPTDVHEFYIAFVDRYEPTPALVTNLRRHCGDPSFSDEQLKQPLIFATRAEADTYAAISNRSAYRTWHFVIDRVRWEGRLTDLTPTCASAALKDK